MMSVITARLVIFVTAVLVEPMIFLSGGVYLPVE